MEGTAGAQAASSPISNLAGLPLDAEGLRHIMLQILLSVGRPKHRCDRCINALARTCKSIHRWFYTKFDSWKELEELMQRVVARRLAALERVADFLFAGQESAWLRQVLHEWREWCIVASTTKRMCRVCGRLFICPQRHFSEYPGCEPPYVL